jgi:hypothetical protein
MGLSNSGAWIKVYIIYPLVPAFLAGLIRYVVKQPPEPWEAISPADVSLSMGILSIFVTQAIFTKIVPLEDDTGRQHRYGIASEFQTLTLVSFGLFVILTFLEALEPIYHPVIEHIKITVLNYCVLVTSLLVIFRAIRVQHTFKLAVS